MNLCPVDGGPVEIVLDLECLRRERPDCSWYNPRRNDMWRFGPLLPLDIGDPVDRSFIFTHGEGHTPLLRFDDHPLAERVGFHLAIKDEGRSWPGYGANPTQSFKDRGMAVAVSMARRLGLRKLALPTQGNAGDSLAQYALAARLEAAIVMPDDAPPPILERIRALAAKHPNVRLELVTGTIREAAARVREKFLPDSYFSVATFHEPGWRTEGKKTMGLELAEPQPGQTDWKLPDVVIYPTGGGTGILGVWKAFCELERLGLIDSRRPKFVAVQSAATAPIVRAFDERAIDVEPVESGTTIAGGLNVPGGVGHRRVLEIIYESQGCAVAVTDAAILATLRQVRQAKRWLLAPEGAACLAALEELVDRRVIRPGDDVVAFNTAAGEKYLPLLNRHVGFT
jgi:threonine synthase